MVILFSFGCHVIDRRYVSTYASTDCTGGVGEAIKRKGGLSPACLGKPHLLYRTFTIWSVDGIDGCQNRIATDQYPMTISQAHVSTHRGDMIYLEAVRWPVNCFTRSRTTFNLILSSVVWKHRETDNAHILDINVLINWQLSKQGSHWPVSLDRIAGSGVDPSKSSIFWSYPLTSH